MNRRRPSRRPLLKLASLIAIAASALTSADANACSLACGGATVAPREGVSVPTNVSGFPLSDFIDLGTGPVSASQFILLDSSGTIVPTTFDNSGTFPILIPKNALVDGQSYRLQFPPGCGKKDAVSERAFTVSGAAGSVSTIGTLVARATYLENALQVDTTGGSCTSPIRAKVIDFEFTPSAELGPYLATGRLLTKVGGVYWAATGFGSISTKTISPLVLGLGARAFNRIFRACGKPDDHNADVGLTALNGVVSLEISVDVPGSQADLPVLSFQLALSNECDLTLLTSDGGNPNGPSTDDNAQKCGTDGSMSGGGCSIATQRGSSSSAFALFALPLAILLRKRRLFPARLVRR